VLGAFALLAICIVGFGCSLGGRAASATGDRAFIVYWPPAEGEQRTRVAIKDLIDMKGTITTAGSEYITKNGSPATRDADCLAEVSRRGLPIVGKTNVTEFAVSVSGMNAFYGTPENRLSDDDRLIPGGSSSGSAVAVANGSADIALGTDTAGSIRVPAACCGIVGLKTTYGLVSLKGVYPISPKHLDTVGPMARTVDRTAEGMDLLQPGFLARYKRASARNSSAQGITVGRLYVKGTNPKVDRAIDATLEAAGFRVVVLDETFARKWADAERDGRTIAAADAWANNQEYAGKPNVSGPTKAILALGRMESANYDAAVRRKSAWQRELRTVLDSVDLIALPTLQNLPPTVPFFGASAVFEALVFDMQNTAAVNFAGNPAVAVPVPIQDRDVPLTSIQLVGRPHGEAELLAAARLVEKVRE
jgi:amidase